VLAERLRVDADVPRNLGLNDSIGSQGANLCAGLWGWLVLWASSHTSPNDNHYHLLHFVTNIPVTFM
jgi:hypothetical protein